MGKFYDITLNIDENLPVWPGESGLVVHWKQKIADGADMNISHLEMSPHTGTHIDAPFHFLDHGRMMGELPLEAMIGEVQVIQVADDCNVVSARELEASGLAMATQRLLVKTRNSRLWEKGEKVFQQDFVAFTPDAAEYLVKKGVRFVGIDYLSVAPFDDPHPAHQILLSAGVICLEGADLSRVKPGQYILYCLPLKVMHVEGAPVRVVLVED